MTIEKIQIDNDGDGLSAAISLNTPEGLVILRVYPWTTDEELADHLWDAELEATAKQVRDMLELQDDPDGE
jgi:hypothetical protein